MLARFSEMEGLSKVPGVGFESSSQCSFAHSSKDFKHEAHADLIYCVGFDTTSSTGYHSLSSGKRIEDLGINRGARGVVAFTIVSRYAIVALKDLSGAAGSEIFLYVTVDTRTWAQAQFPHASSARLRENAYTILDSTTHSLAVDVVLNDSGAVGTLFASNSNGTYFVESLKDMSQNEVGFIDYETLYSVDGVGLANIVANAQGCRRAVTASACDPSDADSCSLHLHSVTIPHNFGRIFSSPAPGFVMGVGSIGGALRPYEESDTFLSTDAGVTWSMVRRDAHKYEFGDQGGTIVAVNDEETVDFVSYSTDLGKTWKTLQLGVHIRARALSTVQDSTSQKFLLLGQLSRRDATDEGRVASIFIRFCAYGQAQRWYAHTAKNKGCLMGHKQWYKRRRLGADCYVGDKFSDPVEHEDICPCQDDDYECDYNYVRHGSSCVPVSPEPIPAGVCKSPDQTYEGSSGYRIIPGNRCDRNKGVKKDEPIKKWCSQAQPEEGNVIHQTFKFPAPIVQHAYFKESTTILVRLEDASVWQSSNEGYTWNRLFPDETFLAFYHYTFTPDRAYLIINTTKFFYTTDTGCSWNYLNAPTPPNTFGVQVLHFHPEYIDWIIWTGDEGGGGGGRNNCHAEAHYSRDNGRRWTLVETYVSNCAWARNKGLLVDRSQILCESFRDKTGSQRFFQMGANPLQLVGGSNFFAKKFKIFDEIYLIVAEYLPEQRSLDLQVSLDGHHFATGQFPPMHPEQYMSAYTVLESSTDSILLHSNWNGTYFGASIDNVNRDQRGFVDFEKMIGLDGIALIDVIANPEAAAVTGTKELQTRMMADSWKPLNPPKYDSHGQAFDPRATFSSPSVVGLIMAVGNVGEKLAPYAESDTFLSRDAGFTWEEVHKDAHLWGFGDSGSILVMANDEEPTDHVLFTTDEGLNWREYKFSDEKIRVRSIVTSPDTDDFESWSPGEERCLSGRQESTLYHRRRRDRNCVVGTQPKAKETIVKNCPCMDSDFECEFNHVRNANGKCVLVEGTPPRSDDDSCRDGEQYWYERTAYRRIPHSTCEDGERPDRGRRHLCPGVAAHGPFFWPHSGPTTGTIRIPGSDVRPRFGASDAGFVETLASTAAERARRIRNVPVDEDAQILRLCG
ncbi:Oligoxyloglucan reducing end-specific cellobiohydrolase [Lactarius akahatsu]|uniref:Oligoxyloglucan reducing end-specific cellobiohydrolase n=1 Tax=Lactarius akahatsu TaxID=416441 RepID=A0AAD4LC16_9AGAM|nr:Oligoxyloglucan reducing end-specific cellobiohydrolase [Lactarius akahatsu]